MGYYRVKYRVEIIGEKGWYEDVLTSSCKLLDSEAVQKIMQQKYHFFDDKYYTPNSVKSIEILSNVECELPRSIRNVKR